MKNQGEEKQAKKPKKKQTIQIMNQCKYAKMQIQKTNKKQKTHTILKLGLFSQSYFQGLIIRRKIDIEFA